VFATSISEGKDRGYSRLLRRQFHQEQIDKLPNELRNAFSNYNYRNDSIYFHIDDNEYAYK